MRVFTCTDHAGHYPVGRASVIVAESEPHARQLLIVELTAAGLDGGKRFTLQELSLVFPTALILNDGNY